MSTFYDANVYGSRVANKLLFVDFYSQVDTFMFCYKKNFTEEKTEGNTDEKEANSINSTFFKSLLQ
jgi:hypothetical protein